MTPCSSTSSYHSGTDKNSHIGHTCSASGETKRYIGAFLNRAASRYLRIKPARYFLCNLSKIFEKIFEFEFENIS